MFEVKTENIKPDLWQSHSTIKFNVGDLVSAKQQYMSHYISGSQSGPILPPKGNFIMAGDIFGCHNSGGITGL